MARKTRSLWGPAPSRFYRLLERVEQAVPDRTPRIAVLGCSDGKFVLPAARRGFDVIAIDIDDVALHGGTTKTADGEPIEMPGLAWRLKVERLEHKVEIVHGDLAEVALTPCDLIFVSGALQYSYNLRHTMANMVSHIQSTVSPGGFLYIEYMLPVKEAHKELENYPLASEWPDFFNNSEWTVLSNHVAEPAEEERDGAKVLGTHRFLHWGYLMARHVPA
ncbi:class I SAM-dependent methyltransferase [Streptomyces sp. NPDC005322]|uniref:class I SAM-dependent methyltransferase n=1 Tax=Streptomyces sp. NPDC005322 TaxID=3157032 RepID=UPI0033A99DBC